MKQFKYIAIIWFVASSFMANAQQIPVLDQYIFNPYLYNPARAGDGDFGNINFQNRLQWVEMPDAPLTNIISMDMPIKDSNVGIGGMIFSDETHLINNYGGLFTYAYHIPFNAAKDHRLSIGLSAGVINQRFDYLKGITEEEIDNALLNETENSMNFDLGAGINYNFKGLNIGFSVPQILANSYQYREPLNLEDVKFEKERHYLVSASYKAQIGEDFTLEPIVLARKVTGIPFQVDGNILAGYKEMFWLGLGYRSVNSLSNASAIHASAAVRVKERFNIAYTYETHLDSDARGDLGNSHEIGVGYRFGGKTKGDKDLLKRLNKLEITTDSIGEKLTDVQEEATEKDIAVNKRIDDLENGIAKAEDLEALRKQVTKNEADIAALKAADADFYNDIKNLQAEMAETKRKLGDLQRGGGGTVHFDKMGSIYFDKGSSDLTATEKSKLDAIYRNVSAGGDFTLFLSGNASTEGSEQYNMALSIRRASTVKKYMESLGMSNTNVFLLPYGEEAPMGSGATVDKNDRRVDLYITR